MSERGTLGTIVMAVLMGVVAIYLEVSPLGLEALAPPSPDLLFCVLAVYAVRAPRAVPLLLVFGLGLMRDLLADLPAGVGALSLVIAVEAMKRTRLGAGRPSFVAEWARAAIVLALMLAGQWAAVLISFAQPPYLAEIAEQFGITIALYPAVAILLGAPWRGRWRARRAA